MILHRPVLSSQEGVKTIAEKSNTRLSASALSQTQISHSSSSSQPDARGHGFFLWTGRTVTFTFQHSKESVVE